MKRVLYLLILAGLMTVGLRAEKVDMTKITPQSYNGPAIKAEVLNALAKSKRVDNGLMPTGGAFDKITTFDRAFGSNYSTLTPMVYEEKSGTIFIVRPRAYTSENNADYVVGALDLLYSRDNGLNWDIYPFVDDTEDHWPLYPSIAVVNPTGSSDLDDMIFYSTSVLFKYDEDSLAYEYQGIEYRIVNLMEDQVVNYTETSPSGVVGQGWNFVETSHYNGDETHYVLNYGVLNPDDGYQYGTYGMGFWDFTGYDEPGFVPSIYGSQVPAGWDIEQFRDPGSPNSSYNGKLDIDFDNEGNAYAAVFNLPSGPDQDKRVPGVSKSTDKGQTWTEFELMPYSVLQAFAASEGAPSDFANWTPALLAYGTKGFVVTGEDQYTFALRINIFKSDEDNLNMMIVDATRGADGTWSVSKISDADYFGALFFNDPDPNNPDDYSDFFGIPIFWNLGNADNFRDTILSNSRHIELQLAKTADNQHLVVKYIDIDPDNPIQLDEPYTFDNTAALEDGVLNEMLNTDIHMGYRPISGGAWNVQNITDNQVYYKQSWIPAIVPSIENVPLLTSTAVKPDASAPTAVEQAVREFPLTMRQMYVDRVVDQDGYFVSVDLTDGMPLDDPRAIIDGVEDSQEFTFEINKIYPNPVKTNRAEIAFTTSAFGNVFIAVYDLQGNKVMDIVNANLGAGVHGKYLDLENLANGTYFVTMTFNGQTVSETLNITR